MRIRCPCCHAEYSIEQAVEDEAARELMGVLADLPREVSRPLAAYLGLWRSKTRALAWERALRVAREALGLYQDTLALGAALSETVEAMRVKQDPGGWRPLTNHNYLKRVVETTAARPSQALAPVRGEGRPAPASRTAQALQDIEEWRRGE
ncbi:MAG: hypothetical protein WED00_05790 [Aquisalimonadaceae bacterium]